MLDGEWQVATAERNGEETKTLRDAYFVFSKDSVRTNIFGSDRSSFYELMDDAIQTNFASQVKFEIAEYTAEKMTLNFNYLDFDFKLLLDKND